MAAPTRLRDGSEHGSLLRRPAEPQGAGRRRGSKQPQSLQSATPAFAFASISCIALIRASSCGDSFRDAPPPCLFPGSSSRITTMSELAAPRFVDLPVRS